MGEDPDAFKMAKLKAEELTERTFADIEHIQDVKIPRELRDLAKDELEQLFPNNQDELIRLLEILPFLSNFLIDGYQEEGECLNEDCKDFIDRLLIELFALTDGKGVVFDFWKHMPQIWHFYHVAESFEQYERANCSTAHNIDQVVKAYSTSYELTLKFITDICLKIAKAKRFTDDSSKVFVKKYSRKVKRNSTISRSDLIEYLNSQSFLGGWQCSILKDPFIRNKIAHADYHYDLEENILVFGGKPYRIEEFKKILFEMYSFYCYLIYRYLQEAGITKTIAEIDRLHGAVLREKQAIDSNEK